MANPEDKHLKEQENNLKKQIRKEKEASEKKDAKIKAKIEKDAKAAREEREEQALRLARSQQRGGKSTEKILRDFRKAEAREKEAIRREQENAKREAAELAKLKQRAETARAQRIKQERIDTKNRKIAEQRRRRHEENFDPRARQAEIDKNLENEKPRSQRRTRHKDEMIQRNNAHQRDITARDNERKIRSFSGRINQGRQNVGKRAYQQSAKAAQDPQRSAKRTRRHIGLRRTLRREKKINFGKKVGSGVGKGLFAIGKGTVGVGKGAVGVGSSIGRGTVGKLPFFKKKSTFQLGNRKKPKTFKQKTRKKAKKGWKFFKKSASSRYHGTHQTWRERAAGGKRVISGIFGPIFWGILVIVAIILVYNLAQAGTFDSLLGKTSTEAENLGIIDGIETVWDKALGVLFDPERLQSDYSFESDIDNSQEAQKLGIKLSKPTFAPGILTTNELIRTFVTASGETTSDSDVIVSCLGDDEVEGGQFILTPTKSGQSRFSILSELGCEYQPPTIEKEIGKITVYNTAEYSFKSKASLKIYMIEKAALEELEGENPLERDNIINLDPRLRIDKNGAYVTKSTATAGPINLGIGSNNNQPLSEEGGPKTISGEFADYITRIQLSHRSGWDGRLTELKDLRLFMPKVFDVNEDTSDFVSTGRTGANEFPEYKLKPELIERVKQVCSGTENIKERDCKEDIEKVADFELNFKVKPTEGSGLYFTFIRAEAEYVFVSTSSKATETVQNADLL